MPRFRNRRKRANRVLRSIRSFRKKGGLAFTVRKAQMRRGRSFPL